jgi:hypothetical protein
MWLPSRPVSLPATLPLAAMPMLLPPERTPLSSMLAHRHQRFAACPGLTRTGVDSLCFVALSFAEVVFNLVQ